MRFLVRVNKLNEEAEGGREEFVNRLHKVVKDVDSRLFFTVFDPEDPDGIIDIEFDVPDSWYPEETSEEDISYGAFFNWSEMNPEFKGEYQKLVQKLSREITKLAQKYNLDIKVIPSKTSYCVLSIQF